MTLSRSARIAGKRPRANREVRRHQKLLRAIVGAAVATLLVAVGCGQAASPAVAARDEQPVDSKNAFAPTSFVSDSRKTLRKLKEEILTLAKQAMETADTTGRSQANVRDLIINQEITAKSAAANYENAKLTREVAEIAIVEYEQGIFIQDELTADGELKLAESNLIRATDVIGLAKDRAAKIKDASDGSVYNLGMEFSYEDQIGESEQRESRARMAVQEARSKLELLRKFTKAKRVTELQIAVAKERATELARQAQWEREKLKLVKLQEKVKKQDSASLPDEGVRSLLKHAISIVEELKSKLDLAAKDREPSEAARKRNHESDGAAPGDCRADAGGAGGGSMGGSETENPTRCTPLPQRPIEVRRLPCRGSDGPSPGAARIKRREGRVIGIAGVPASFSWDGIFFWESAARKPRTQRRTPPKRRRPLAHRRSHTRPHRQSCPLSQSSSRRAGKRSGSCTMPWARWQTGFLPEAPRPNPQRLRCLARKPRSNPQKQPASKRFWLERRQSWPSGNTKTAPTRESDLTASSTSIAPRRNWKVPIKPLGRPKRDTPDLSKPKAHRPPIWPAIGASRERFSPQS